MKIEHEMQTVKRFLDLFNEKAYMHTAFDYYYDQKEIDQYWTCVRCGLVLMAKDADYALTRHKCINCKSNQFRYLKGDENEN